MTVLGPLLHQRLRRDRVQLGLWIGGTAALAAAGFAGVQGSYGDEHERAALLATVLANPVILLFRGLPSGAGQSQMVVFLVLPWLLLLAALMSTFLAVRHTRGDEEDGRLDLLAATPAARWMPTLATLVHGAGANLLLGALVTAAFLANGAAVPGSTLVGVSCALVGVVFVGLGLVAAQLMPTSRAANSLATWVLVATFLLAGLGNALGTPSDDLTRLRSAWPTWLSPFGWAENTRAFDVDAWGPIALLGAAAAAAVVAALALQSRRDLGASFVPEWVGPAGAGRRFGSNLALIRRLSRPATVGWAVSGALVGALATSLGTVANQIGSENPAVADVLDRLSGSGGDLERGIVVVFFMMLGILAACAGVQTVIRARQDEARGTAEAVLGAAVGRVRWFADYVVVALIAATVTVVAGVAGAMSGALAREDTGGLVRDAVIAGAGQVLSACVFVGLTAVVFALAPRLTIALAWSLVMLAGMVGLFAPLFGVDERIARLSPFSSALVPTADGVDLGGLWWIVVASVLLGGSLALMRRRELVP